MLSDHRGTRGVYNLEMSSVYEDAFLSEGFNHTPNGRVKVRSTCGLCSSSRKKKTEKCAYVFYDIGAYTCSHCKESGVIQVPEGSFKQNKVSKTSGPVTAPQPIKIDFRKPDLPKEVSNEQLSDFIMKRGLTEDTLSKIGIFNTVTWIPQMKSEQPAVAFPYYRGGELINVKYRGPNKNFKLEGGAELIPYNVDSLDSESPYVIITEGEMDAASWVEAGEECVISSPNGSSVNLSWLSSDDVEKIKGKIILLSCDHDEAGQLMISAIKERFSGHNIIKEVNHRPYKDANKVLQEEGVMSLLKRKEEALNQEVKGIVKVDNWMERVDKIVSGGGIPSGDNIDVEELDRLITYRRKDVTFITGTPGDGKSTFVDFVVGRLAYIHAWKVLFLSVEKPDTAIHVIEIIEKVSKVKMSMMSANERDDWKEWVKEHFIFINIEEQALSSDEIFKKVYEVNALFDIDAFVLDNIAMLEDSPEANSDHNHLLNRVVSKITHMAKSCNIHIFVVAHPKKPSQSRVGNPTPSKGYDIAGSSNVYNKTDNGITVFRDRQRGCVVIYIWKVRWWFVGTEGQVMLDWVPEIRSYKVSESRHKGLTSKEGDKLTLIS